MKWEDDATSKARPRSGEESGEQETAAFPTSLQLLAFDEVGDQDDERVSENGRLQVGKVRYHY